MCADDLGLAARRHDLVAKGQQECGGGAVERVHRRQIERQVRRRRAGEPLHVLPGVEALPEAELPREAQLRAAVLQVDPLDAESGVGGARHARPGVLVRRAARSMECQRDEAGVPGLPGRPVDVRPLERHLIRSPVRLR